MKIDVAQNQIQGDRDYQQDDLGQRDIEGFKLLVLADGMGGYNGGEIASKIVVDTFMMQPFLNEDDFLEEALHSANKKISDYKELNSDVANMGTTLIALLISETSYRWISVGDSLLYLIRDNEIKRLNDNHSVAGMLNLQVARGEISKEKAEENRNRHMLTSAILGEEISMVDVSITHDLKRNDKLILASDGIETLSENELLTIINQSSTDLIASEKIFQEIGDKKKKNQDNASIVIVTPQIKKTDENREQMANDNTIIKVSLFLFVVFILFSFWK